MTKKEMIEEYKRKPRCLCCGRVVRKNEINYFVTFAHGDKSIKKFASKFYIHFNCFCYMYYDLMDKWYPPTNY